MPKSSGVGKSFRYRVNIESCPDSPPTNADSPEVGSGYEAAFVFVSEYLVPCFEAVAQCLEVDQAQGMAPVPGASIHCSEPF